MPRATIQAPSSSRRQWRTVVSIVSPITASPSSQAGRPKARGATIPIASSAEIAAR